MRSSIGCSISSNSVVVANNYFLDVKAINKNGTYKFFGSQSWKSFVKRMNDKIDANFS
jgi:hypothetical protein